MKRFTFSTTKNTCEGWRGEVDRVASSVVKPVPTAFDENTIHHYPTRFFPYHRFGLLIFIFFFFGFRRSLR